MEQDNLVSRIKREFYSSYDYKLLVWGGGASIWSVLHHLPPAWVGTSGGQGHPGCGLWEQEPLGPNMGKHLTHASSLVDEIPTKTGLIQR